MRLTKLDRSNDQHQKLELEFYHYELLVISSALYSLLNNTFKDSSNYELVKRIYHQVSAFSRLVTYGVIQVGDVDDERYQ